MLSILGLIAGESIPAEHAAKPAGVTEFAVSSTKTIPSPQQAETPMMRHGMNKPGGIALALGG